MNLPALSRGLIQSISLGMVTQGLSSAANFGIAVYLVRKLDPAGFGLWGLGFSIILLALGLANGLLLSQMVVGLPHRKPWMREAYMRSVLVGTLLLATILSVLGLLVAALAGLRGDAGGDASLAATTGVAAGGVITLHYFVRQSFSVSRERVAVLLNLVLLASLTVAVAWVERRELGISASSAMLIYGGAHFCAALCGALVLPVPTRHWQIAMVRRDLLDVWQQGRWASAGVSVSWGQSQAYVYLTPLFFGLAGLGAVNAARMIVAPLIMMLPAISQVALPRFSVLSAEHPGQLGHAGLRLSVVLGSLAVMYALIVWLGYDWLSLLLLGEVREELFWITMAWCLLAGLALVRQVATVIMQALRDFLVLFRVEAAVLAVTVTSMLVLLPVIGLVGAVLATALGEALIALLVWRALTRRTTPSLVHTP